MIIIIIIIIIIITIIIIISCQTFPNLTSWLVDGLALCCAWRERTPDYPWGSTHFSGDNDPEKNNIIVIIIRQVASDM